MYAVSMCLLHEVYTETYKAEAETMETRLAACVQKQEWYFGCDSVRPLSPPRQGRYFASKRPFDTRRGQACTRLAYSGGHDY